MHWIQNPVDGNCYSEDRIYAIQENERGYQLTSEGLVIGCYSSDHFAKMSAEQHASGKNQVSSISSRTRSYVIFDNNAVEENDRFREDHYRAD